MNNTFLITTILLFLFSITTIAQENSAITCSDGIDNDGDGWIDCLDSDCANLPTDMDNGCLTCFSDGRSFVDSVLAFEPACPTNMNTNPQAALGVANWAMAGDDVSLGEGGSITLGFTNNLVVNSGNGDPDIWVFEVGPRVEDCTIELRPADQITIDRLNTAGITDNDGDGFYDFGIIANQNPSIDIDGVVNGFAFSELKFDAIQITDVPQMCVPGSLPGADIDAVCALTSIDIDCAGTLNGSAILDSCGVCLPPDDPRFNQACLDCNGTPNGTAILDSCGVCLEVTDPSFNQACLDCNGTPNGAAILDSCDVCLEITNPSFNQACLDCNDMPNGDAILDSCGICLEITDPSFNQACVDCAGMPNGNATLDSCGVCLEITDPSFNQTCLDCNGIINGTAEIDNCGKCLVPTDPNFNQSCSQKNQVYIPNVFSPNNDGRNDRFQILKSRELNAQVNTYLIFNRWGSLVYKASNFDFNTRVHWWDGTFNRQKLESGVFFYFIEVEIENVGIKQYEGTITIGIVS